MPVNTPSPHAPVAVTASPAPAPASSRAPRLVGLDTVRGLAICGILFTNASTVLGAVVPWVQGRPQLIAIVEGVLFHERFFPIFSFLFGIGFAIMFSSAGRRAARPRVVMIQRFAALALLGLAHMMLHPGEALLPYAIAGLLVLLPLSFVPQKWRPWVPAVLGVLLMIPGAYAGGIVAIPGLFVLGTAVADAGLHQRAERSAGPGLVLAGVGALVAIPMTLWQLSAPELAGFSPVSAIAGLATVAVFVGLTLALLHTPVRRLLTAFFVPLGRTALTCYVSATLVGVAIGAVLFSPPALGGEAVVIDQTTKAMIWAGCAVLLVVQSLVARWWLARFGQGPLEKLWRAVTWAGAKPVTQPASR